MTSTAGPAPVVLEKLGMRLVETVASVCGRELEYFRIDAPAGPLNALNEAQ